MQSPSPWKRVTHLLCDRSVLLSKFIESIPDTQLVRQKLGCMVKMVESELFRQPGGMPRGRGRGQGPGAWPRSCNQSVSLLHRLPGRPAAAGHRPAERTAGRPFHQAGPGGLRPAAVHRPGHPGPQGRGETRLDVDLVAGLGSSADSDLFQGPTRTHVQLIMERLLRRVNRTVIAMETSSPLIVRTLTYVQRTCPGGRAHLCCAAGSLPGLHDGRPEADGRPALRPPRQHLQDPAGHHRKGPGPPVLRPPSPVLSSGLLASAAPSASILA